RRRHPPRYLLMALPTCSTASPRWRRACPTFACACPTASSFSPSSRRARLWVTLPVAFFILPLTFLTCPSISSRFMVPPRHRHARKPLGCGLVDSGCGAYGLFPAAPPPFPLDWTG